MLASVKPVLLAPALLALVLTACSSGADGDPHGLGTPSKAPQPSTRTASPQSPPVGSKPGLRRVVRTLATGLKARGGVTFLPDGSALVSERDTARVLAVDDGSVRPVGTVKETSPQGEAGL